MKFYYLAILLIPFVCFAQKTKYIQADDYAIDNALLKNGYDGKEINGIYFIDQVWFKNDSLKQSILISLYTDYHRIHILHFKNDSVPYDLLPYIQFFKKVSQSELDTVSPTVTQKNIPIFLKGATTLPKKYFVTKHGLKLGLTKTALLKKCGAPHSTTTKNNLEVLVWNYPGDQGYTENQKKPQGTLAKNSFGYTLTTFLKNDQVIALRIDNDIP